MSVCSRDARNPSECNSKAEAPPTSPQVPAAPKAEAPMEQTAPVLHSITVSPLWPKIICLFCRTLKGARGPAGSVGVVVGRNGYSECQLATDRLAVCPSAGHLLL